MRMLNRMMFFVLLMLTLTSCKKTLQPDELPAHINIGDRYYTQFVIRYEKNAHVTTNYRRGASIPVNTQVTLLNITSKTIEVEVPDMRQPLLIKSLKKHTGDDITQAFDKLFSVKKLNLRKFNSLERKYIKQGVVKKGMRRGAVIAAIGYPPITETPSLNANRWVYWSGRFNRFNVHFNNGKVSRVED